MIMNENDVDLLLFKCIRYKGLQENNGVCDIESELFFWPGTLDLKKAKAILAVAAIVDLTQKSLCFMLRKQFTESPGTVHLVQR